MKPKALPQIIEWLESSTAYLSTSTDYARGYKDGIEQAKSIIKDIIGASSDKPRKAAIHINKRDLCNDLLAKSRKFYKEHDNWDFNFADITIQVFGLTNIVPGANAIDIKVTPKTCRLHFIKLSKQEWESSIPQYTKISTFEQLGASQERVADFLAGLTPTANVQIFPGSCWYLQMKPANFHIK